MADTDEAAIHAPSNDSSMHIETDLSDETQDFRMLNNLSFLSDNSGTTLPKRGEKDFEPNPTLFQADVLSASRQAMHNALSYPRLHHPRNKVVGVYAPDGPVPPPSSTTTMESIAEENKPKHETESKSKKPKSEVGVPAESCVYVCNPKGQYFKNIGRADRWNRIWLLPEEALYLLERGSLDIRWPASATGCWDKSDTGDSGIPMSLQAAYASFIGRSGLTMERFSVYTGLRRLGYAVIRASPGWYDDEREEKGSKTEHTEVQKQGPGLAGIFSRFLEWLSDSASSCPATGPLVGVGIHRSYEDIYRKLFIIPWYDPATPQSQSPQTTPPFRVVFHVYKPSTTFRKTAPPPPDFRIAVVDARTQTTMPTVDQIGALLESTPFDPPRGEKMEKMTYMRLRHGYRNVILAVVDQGVVSYIRVADAAFGKEKLYKAQAPKGGKGNKRNWQPRPKR